MTAAAEVRRPWTKLTPEVALADIARAVNSSLELQDILHTVVRLTQEVMLADRATILLLDAEECLTPAVSHGRIGDAATLERFRNMPPVSVGAIPHARELLSQPDALVITDVAVSTIVPAVWKRAFGLKSLLLAPIVADGGPLGVLVVDYSGKFAEVTPSLVSTLEAIAAGTATAMRNARLFGEVVRRADSLDESLRITAELNAATTSRAVCEVALDGLARVLGGHRASVHLYDQDSIVTLASRGGGHPEPGTYALSAEARTAIDNLMGQRGAPASDLSPIAPFTSLSTRKLTVLLPLTDPPPPGFVLITCDAPPDDERWRLARSIAGQVWLALDRARHMERAERRLEHLETIYHLADELAFAPDLDAIVERVAEPVRAATGCEAIDVFLRTARGSDRFVSRPPGRQLGALMRSWSRTPPTRPLERAGLLIVPMLLDGELLGVLRLRSMIGRLGTVEGDFLLALATGIGGVIARADLDARMARAERELTVVEERERIARDLHDTLGQSLFTLGLQLAQCEQSADDALRPSLQQARGATDAAAIQLRQAIHALAFLSAGQQDLRSSLRALARELPDGITAVVRTSGSPMRVPPASAEALLRVAREAFVNVERHSRATSVHAEVRYRSGRVELVIADNGTGLGERSTTAAAGLHFGIRTMRMRLEQLGGTVVLQDIEPHGLRITASVPVP